MRNLRSPRITLANMLAAVLATSALLGVASAQAAPQRHRAHSSRHHAHGHHHGHKTVTTSGPAGPQGPRGPQGATGPTGPQGPQGPGAVVYTYDSTAPAATEQNTPLGSAGPMHLAASCVQLGPNLIAVVLSSSQSNIVQYDETLGESSEGMPVVNSMSRLSAAISPVPQVLLGLGASSAGTKESFAQATMTLTQPVHGQLSVFADVSEANNTCHLSVMWTPAS
jgi:hypothetical protein